VKLSHLSLKTLVFKAKINNPCSTSCKAGSWRNANIFAFDCKTYCCKTWMYVCTALQRKRTNLYVLRSTGNAYDVISHRRLSGPRAPSIFWTSLRLCIGANQIRSISFIG